MTGSIAKMPTGIVIFDDCDDESRTLDLQLAPFGYAVTHVAAASDLIATVRETDSPFLLVRARSPEIGADRRKALTELCEEIPETAIIFLTEQGSLNARVNAIRCGATAYITAPYSAFDIVDRLESLGGLNQDQPYRVMIVDDDPQIARYHEAILHQANITTVIVPDASETLNVMTEFRPELILMDFYMPDYDGRELAAAIRQEPAYDSIPIVFLSGEGDRDVQQRVMRIGGDDFLTKPIRPDHLLGAVLLRARRFRSLRAMMLRDSLTGLLNHTATKEQVSIALAGARRRGKDLAFAMLDIDKFKGVNDTYGHPVGDQVLRSLSLLLKQRLRTTDIIGRYGGEEFVVALPETPLSNATRVLNDIREGFSEIEQPSHIGPFRVTLSCGVATFPLNDGVEALTEAADKALYGAKRNGRNQVMQAS
ncbi:MAG: diguanylate cyclase [Alphaproteobacteria bacterium]|uniref:diguanylate cyclase n=1 Tax=Pacificispira sp. TaxID=2888761 RepID=UPI001B0F7539|nr:diguanylate cyclase [Alphaproteobacteria bacterium]MEC9267101.1 diguanylate cyclase [Pseudomonadota bacterium]